MCWVGLPRSLRFECRAGWRLRTLCADLLVEAKNGVFLGPLARGSPTQHTATHGNIQYSIIYYTHLD